MKFLIMREIGVAIDDVSFNARDLDITIHYLAVE